MGIPITLLCILSWIKIIFLALKLPCILRLRSKLSAFIGERRGALEVILIVHDFFQTRASGKLLKIFVWLFFLFLNIIE